MTVMFGVIGTLVVAAVLFVVLRSLLKRYVDARGDRVVACPADGQAVVVRVDAAHAALTSSHAHGHFRIESCTRWPVSGGCGQGCLAQIASQPADCLVRAQVERWYAGKSCALCGKALDGLDWTRHKPAVRTPEGLTLEWKDVQPERLHEVMATHAPVCWDCHVAETFRRVRPDLVIDNPRPTA